MGKLRGSGITAVFMCFTVLLAVGTVGPAASAATRSGAAVAAMRPSSTVRASALPTGFAAQSQSWISTTDGRLLGSAPCGQTTCTTVIGTNDGGTTWGTLGTLGAPLTHEEASGATEIRFADDLHGWAFEPALYATSDGGATWQHQAPPGGGHMVLALSGDADGVYAIVSACRLNRLCQTPATLWRTTPGQGSWTQVSVTLPVISGFDTAVLAVHGPVAYLVVPSAAILAQPGPDLLDVTTDGQTWSTRPDPCMPANDEFLTSVAPISDTKVALLCQSDIGFGKAAKHVLRSNDNGQTTRSAGTLPLYGIVSQLSATRDGTLVVSSYSIGSWIYRNAGGQTWTTSEDLGDGGMGWNDISFTTNQVGFVIHGPVSCCGGFGPGELWETQDGGVTWAPV